MKNKKSKEDKEEKNIYNMWKNIDIMGEDECWEWIGCYNKNKKVNINCKSIGGYTYVNRAIYYLNNGDIPKGYSVKHSCENILCCNPSHLVLVKNGEKLDYDVKFIARVWSHILVMGENECWEWQAHKSRDGYGRTQYNNKGVTISLQPHRIIYEIYYGKIPDGFEIMHYVCDNPACCNPKHLKIGTHLQNVQEIYAKGRNNRIFGETNPAARLKEYQVIEILKKNKYDNKSTSELAAEYGVGPCTINLILKNKAWKHINRETI